MMGRERGRGRGRVPGVGWPLTEVSFWRERATTETSSLLALGLLPRHLVR